MFSLQALDEPKTETYNTIQVFACIAMQISILFEYESLIPALLYAKCSLFLIYKSHASIPIHITFCGLFVFYLISCLSGWFKNYPSGTKIELHWGSIPPKEFKR